MAYIEQPASGGGKTLVLVHGRGWKPDADALARLWREALAAGLARDYPEAPPLAAFRAATVRLVYYGDLSNRALEAAGQRYDAKLDLEDRRAALAALQALPAKKFRRAAYERLPGRSSLKEFLADIGAPLLAAFRLTDAALQRAMPEVTAYWDRAGDFAELATGRLIDELKPLLAADRDVLIISHCLGSVITYDALWELSRGSEAIGGRRKVDTWITLGSPLADEFVKRQLRGADQGDEARYPANLVSWHNVSAEDDYTCHDDTVANDYRRMLDDRLVSRIRDHHIYNLTVRYGRSNPHSSLGYLLHPRVIRMVADWLG